MKLDSVVIKKSAISLFIVALLFFGYLVQQSQMISYLSKDPKACINCHVMNTQYATWQHSAHGVAGVTCIQCHLPTDNVFEKYYAKTIDGWNHSVAFTNRTYDHAMKISDYGAERVQKNCLSCHASLASQIAINADKYHNFSDANVETGRKCWECHKGTPHGKTRSLTTTPYNLGIKDNK